MTGGLEIHATRGGRARLSPRLDFFTLEILRLPACLDFLTNENVWTYGCLDFLTNENVWTYVAPPRFSAAAPANRLDKKCHFLPVGNFENSSGLFDRIVVIFIRIFLTFKYRLL